MSSDHSDGELSPASPAALEDEMIMVPTQTWSHSVARIMMINSFKHRWKCNNVYVVLKYI